MQDISHVGRTAFLIAEIRLDESTREDALFHDKYASAFHHPESAEAARRYQQVAPVFTSQVRIRTRWLDDIVAGELSLGTRQVVILGAGFDCRPLKYARPGVTFFEVDQHTLLSYKTERLTAAGHGNTAVAVPVDYCAPGLIDALKERGFDPGLRTLVIWEGNTYYLPTALVRDVLRNLAAGMTNVRVAFDYFHPAIVEGRSSSPGLVAAVPILKKIGAPWQGGVEDVRALAAEIGLRVVVDHRLADLHSQLLPHRTLGADAGAEVGLCVLASPPGRLSN